MFLKDFGLPNGLNTKPKNPHCLHVTWKVAIGPVTGYRVYCFPGDSQKADIVYEILNGNEHSAMISGLQPDTTYTVGITSLSYGNESKKVFIQDQARMRKL